MNVTIPANQYETPEAAVADQYEYATARWVIFFVLISFSFQIGRFILGDIPALKVPLRIGVYATSLLALFIVRGTGPTHPAARVVPVAIGILIIAAFNPLGNSALARLAQICLYVSVLAPIIWVGRMRIDRQVFYWVVRLLWAFYTLSAIVGVLQSVYPGSFVGAVSANYDERSLTPHTLTLADGSKIIQPKGLSDTLGGAGLGGVYAIVLGTGLLLMERNVLIKAAAIGGMIAGLFCIYICQGRTYLIVVVINALIVLVLLMRRGNVVKASMLGGVLVAVALIGTPIAMSVGGRSTVERYLTLIADDPASVYQANRGMFLIDLLTNDIFIFPFGAGVARWGQMASYFGSDLDPLWAEMQWQGILYDGGIPLTIAYLALFGILFVSGYRIATRSPSDDVGCWGAVVVGYSVSAFIASFSFPLMCQQLGVELMLANACLYSYAAHATKPEPQPLALSESYS